MALEGDDTCRLGDAVPVRAGLRGDVLLTGLRVVIVLGLVTVLIGVRGGAATEVVDLGASGVVGADAL
jgi:hypothetical protein